MGSRLERLEKLEKATKEYVASEKKRIEDECSSLEAILEGRTGGAGVQKASTAAVAAVAFKDLDSFLRGA